MRLSRRLLYNRDTLKTELLHTQVQKLGLRIKGTLLEGCIGKVMDEVREFGLKLEPRFYLSDGYGCVEGTTNIALAFWDADPLLREIRRDIDDVLRDEGDITLVLKHEVGHAFCYAHKLYRLKEFRELFNVEGNFFRTYPDHHNYRPDPWSADYVNPDGDHYAQKHPDDDFAETFCVYIDRTGEWRQRYRAKSGALRKLGYVAKVIRQYGAATPLVEGGPAAEHMAIEDISKTVAEFFGVSPRRYWANAEGFFDTELLALCKSGTRAGLVTERVSQLVVRYRKFIERAASSRHGIDDARLIPELIEKVRGRATALGLRYRRADEEKVLADVMAFLLRKAWYFQHFTSFRGRP